MRRKELLARSGVTLGYFTVLRHRRQLPFEVVRDGSPATDFSESDATRLGLMAKLMKAGLTLAKVRELAMRDDDKGERVLATLAPGQSGGEASSPKGT